MPDEKGPDRQIIIILGITCILIFFTLYYVENREIKDAHTLAGRVIDASKRIDSYQFGIHSNISMLGESFTLVRGNGTVDYKNRKMSIKMRSMEDSMALIVADDHVYSTSDGDTWKKQKLNHQTWENYDQLTRTNVLLSNSTELSMERTNEYLILTAFPENRSLLLEAEKAGLDLKGDERLTKYSIRYFVEKDSYRVISITSDTEFVMNVQGLMSPVAINNQVNIYNYNTETDIEEPI